MSTIKVMYKLSDEGINDHLMETGEQLERLQRADVEMADLTKDQRRRIVLIKNYHGETSLNLSNQYVKLSRWEPPGNNYKVKPIRWLARDSVEFDHVMSLEGIMAEITAYADRLKGLLAQALPKAEAAKAEIEAKEAEKQCLKNEAEQLLARAKAVAADEDALRKLLVGTPVEVRDFYIGPRTSTASKFHATFLAPFEEAREEERKLQAEKEQQAWIEAHGSDRLKQANARGYEVGRIYAVERSEHEAPEFEIDFYDEAEWNERTNPTTTELDELDKAEALDLGKGCKIVWLTKVGCKEPEENVEEVYWREIDFKPAPAIVIWGYLGKYDLIKTL
jgi:hypothetical protein